MPPILPTFAATSLPASVDQSFSPRWLGVVAIVHVGILVGLLNAGPGLTAPDEEFVQPVNVLQVAMISESAVAKQPPSPSVAASPQRPSSPTVPKLSRPASQAARSAPTASAEVPAGPQDVGAHATAPMTASVPPGNTAGPPAAAAATMSQPRFDADYLKNPAPDYPIAAKRFGEEGRVMLRVFVDADGRAESIEIKSSSGFDRLDQAALDAVRRWKFVPARRVVDGAPIAVGAWVAVPIVFTLRSG